MVRDVSVCIAVAKLQDAVSRRSYLLPRSPGQGLAIAQLLNYTYIYDSGFAEDWLAHLPNRVEPGLMCPNVTEVVHACATCTRHDLWEFTMNCPAGWPKVR